MKEKIKIAEAEIKLFDDNRVFISSKNIPFYDKESNKTIEFIHPERLNGLMFLFYFDKVLSCMNKKVAFGTIESIHTMVSQHMNLIQGNLQFLMSNEKEWLTFKKKLKTPNDWHFLKEEEKNLAPDFYSSIELFLINNRFFCLTSFSKDKFIEAKAYLTIEAFYQYAINTINLDEFIYNFITSLGAQCTVYQGNKPALTQLGKAVEYGLQQAQKLRKEHGIE